MDTQRNRVGWREEQWNRIQQAVDEEIDKVRVAAKFLPVYGGTIAATARDVPAETVNAASCTVDDLARIKLVEIWAKFTLNRQQIQDEELSNALVLFRRAANVLARLEDAIIFNGQPGANKPPAVPIKLPGIDVKGGQKNGGLLRTYIVYDPKKGDDQPVVHTEGCDPNGYGEELVTGVTKALTRLDESGYSNPYALVMGTDLFSEAHRPTASMVLPMDRINPLIESQSWRSGVLPKRQAALISLGGNPVDLAIAVKATPRVFKVKTSDTYTLGVYQSFALRLKEPEAVVRLEFEMK